MSMRNVCHNRTEYASEERSFVKFGERLLPYNKLCVERRILRPSDA